MKKIIPILLIAFAPLFSQGQAYTPLNLDTSSFWVHHYYYYTGVGGSGKSASARVVSYVEKDTVIQNKSYSKVIAYISKQFQNTVSPFHFSQFPLTKYFREDTAVKKLYFFDFQNNRDSVCLDFNLQVSDTVNIHSYKKTMYPIYIVDSLQIKSHYARPLRTTFWQHQDANNFETNEQIEGVGLKYQFPFNVGGGEWNAPGFTCLCYEKKDTIEYLGKLNQWTPFLVDSCYKQARYIAGPSATKNFELSSITTYIFSNRLIINNANGDKLSIKLINLQGKALYEIRNSAGNIELSLSPYSTGIYILSLQSSKGIENRKILIR